MTQEEKQLLLKDLCARLPYLPIVEIYIYRDSNRKSDIELDPHVTENIWELIDKYHAIPYLRPMSSMTEEEWADYQKIRMIDWVDGDINGTFINAGLIVDWLNKNHFDFRGLIERGLAVAVTKENNPYEK